MLSFLQIPPLHLSITARGFVRSSIAQPLSALWSSAALAFVGARRASLTLASSRFSVGAPLLALGRACGSRRLSLVRLGRWARCAPVSVVGQQSRFGGRSINPSSPGSANPSVKRRLSEHSTPRGAPYFHVGYQFAVSGRKSAQTFNNLIEVSIQ